LTAALEDVLRSRSTAEWLARLAEAGVPAGDVRDLAQVFASEQVRALGIVRELHHPTAGDHRVVGSPIRFDPPVPASPTAAPELGEHTLEVLSDLGYDRVDVDALVTDGVAMVP
jgi:crotonobetainyl-CoA:carnitine CoA-transferase CaiB-like acyl-CoA transferase